MKGKSKERFDRRAIRKSYKTNTHNSYYELVNILLTRYERRKGIK
jgi:hypothetical protein